MTVAFRLPVQQPSTADPTTITLMMLALDDSQVRITQSREEQTPAGAVTVAARAGSLGATQARVFAGGSVPGVPISSTQVFCSLRTAGTRNAPTANLLNRNSTFVSLSPSPFDMTGSGSHIAHDATFHATFVSAVDSATSSNFVVRGLISGQAFRGQTYTGNGTTTVSTPPGAFLPGEDVEVTLTTGLACPTPWVGRQKVGVTVPTSGLFENAIFPQTGSNPRVTATGDFDRDGNLDLAVVSSTTSSVVTILFGDGTGEFPRSGNVQMHANSQWIVAGDFNGDGILDLATANSTDGVTVALGSASAPGTFGAPHVFPVGGANATKLVAGDLNGDGVLDLAIASFTAGSVSMLLGNGDGTFVSAGSVATDPGLTDLAIGDMNEDGKLDFVVSNVTGASGSITAFLQSGGTFTRGGSFAVGSPPQALALGDVNEDGHLDVALAEQGATDETTECVVVTGSGAGTFVSAANWLGGIDLELTRANTVAFADINGDGHLDLVCGGDNPFTHIIFVVSGDGMSPPEFRGHTEFDTPNVAPASLTIADLNHDGVLDVVVGNGTVGGTTIAVLPASGP